MSEHSLKDFTKFMHLPGFKAQGITYGRPLPKQEAAKVPVARDYPGALMVEYPIKLVNTLNAREHWAKRTRRVKQERHAAHLTLFSVYGKCEVTPPLRITMLRIFSGRAQEMDDDGLHAATKATRDGIADWLGIDDAERNGLEWVCVQERREKTTDAVRITIQRKDG